jgi:hypothetical protein
MFSNEINCVADYCRAHVDLLDLPTDYGYPSLTLCVIDAVYSINAHYNGVLNVIARYCTHCGISADWPDYQRPATSEAQQPVSDLLARMKQHGAEAFTLNVFQNQQRTSTRSGILKGEAVYQFAQALERHHIEYVQDLPAVVAGSSLEDAIFRIPGQSSGVSLRYFQMLAGSDDLIKPDRMILNFLASILNRPVSLLEAQEVLMAVSSELKPVYPMLTPRLLDNRIWMYQRQR